MPGAEAPSAVHVSVQAADDDRSVLEDAVVGAGGVLSSPAAAEVLVWARNDVRELVPFLHDGIRWVQLYAAGVDAWINGGVIDRNRLWTAAKGVYAGVIAEYCLALLLAGAARLPEAARAATWKPLRADTVAGKTVGVVGAGGIGTELIRLLQPFTVRTLALTRSGRSVPLATTSLGPTDLDQLLRESNYVVLCAAATPQSRGLLSRERIALMKPDAFVVNIARGSLVDTNALVEAIEDGRLRGAALDVTHPEPLPDDHPLWRLPNVIVTPHMSGSAPAWREAFAERLRTNLDLYMNGEPLVGVVDLDAGY
jgi:phosphoglycerate dehydrogenase-like enzyme